MAQEFYSFFGSTPGDIRSYDESRFAAAMRTFMRNGVAKTGDCLKVSAEGGTMRVRINPGQAFIEGYFYELKEDGNGDSMLTLNASSTYDRIARVTLRLSLSERKIALRVVHGTAASSPEAPVLARNANVYDISLAQVYIRAGATSISEGDITDERSNDSVCGYMVPDALRLNSLWDRMTKKNVTSARDGLMSMTDKSALDALKAALVVNASRIDVGGRYIDNALFR